MQTGSNGRPSCCGVEQGPAEWDRSASIAAAQRASEAVWGDKPSARLAASLDDSRRMLAEMEAYQRRVAEASEFFDLDEPFVRHVMPFKPSLHQSKPYSPS